MVGSRRQYGGTALGVVHPEPGKQTGDINPRRGKDALEFADSSAAEFSGTFGAALRLRRKIRLADFPMRWSSLGRSELGRHRFDRSGFGSLLRRSQRLALRSLLLDREKFPLDQFQLAAECARFTCQR